MYQFDLTGCYINSKEFSFFPLSFVLQQGHRVNEFAGKRQSVEFGPAGSDCRKSRSYRELAFVRPED